MQLRGLDQQGLQPLQIPLTADNLRAVEAQQVDEHEVLGRFVGGSNSLIDRRRLQALLGVPPSDPPPPISQPQQPGLQQQQHYSPDSSYPAGLPQHLSTDSYVDVGPLLSQTHTSVDDYSLLSHPGAAGLPADYSGWTQPQQHQQQQLGRSSLDYDPAGPGAPYLDSHWHSHATTMSTVDHTPMSIAAEDYASLGTSMGGLSRRPPSPKAIGSQGGDAAAQQAQLLSGGSFQRQARPACGRSSMEYGRPAVGQLAPQLAYMQGTCTQAQHAQQAAQQLGLLAPGMGGYVGAAPAGGGGAIGQLPTAGGAIGQTPLIPEHAVADHSSYYQQQQRMAPRFSGHTNRLIGPLPAHASHEQQQQQQQQAALLHSMYGRACCSTSRRRQACTAEACTAEACTAAGRACTGRGCWATAARAASGAWWASSLWARCRRMRMRSRLRRTPSRCGPDSAGNQLLAAAPLATVHGMQSMVHVAGDHR